MSARAKRGELLDATQKKLTSIQNRVRRAKKPLRGKDKIALAVGAVIDRYKMAKHFALTITDDDATFERKIAQIKTEAAPEAIRFKTKPQIALAQIRAALGSRQSQLKGENTGMADYYSLIAKAVGALDLNTEKARRRLYERARTPPLSPSRKLNASFECPIHQPSPPSPHSTFVPDK